MNEDKVIDSRLSEGGEVIRRRRVCTRCRKRFTTKERVEQEVRLLVIKRDGTRMPYDRSKILAGLQRACYKRPIDDERLAQLTDEVEDALFKQFDREVSSKAIGDLVAQRLRDVDHIAYVRFASVYRQFQELGEFIEEVQEVIDHKSKASPGQRHLFE